MSCTRTYATLRIFSPNLGPDVLSEKLGIVPTECEQLDPKSKYKHRREFSYWSLSTKEMLDSTNNIEHLQLILKKLFNKSSVLESLRSHGCSTDIFCFWESNGQGGPCLDIEIMKDLVNYGLDICWDMYFDDEKA